MMTCTLWKQLQQLPEGPGCAGGDSPRENSSIRYAFTCNRGLLARQSRIVFNTRPFFRCFFLFTEGSMKFVGGMHHHKYNGMSFFFCPKWICHWIFFPVHLYLTHDFVNIYFYEIHFRWWLPDHSEKKLHIAFQISFNFRFHPMNLFISSSNRDFFVLNWR